MYYDPTGRHDFAIDDRVFDEDSGIEYIAVSNHPSIDFATTVAIARSLYR